MRECTGCGRFVDESNFSKDRRSLNGLQLRCKQCNKEYRDSNKEKIKEYIAMWKERNQQYNKVYSSRYYAQNSTKYSERYKATYDKGRKIVNDEKASGCCACGLVDECLSIFEFHHVDPKQKEIRVAALVGSPVKLRREIDKCVVLCSNCHKIIHAAFDRDLEPVCQGGR